MLSNRKLQRIFLALCEKDVQWKVWTTWAKAPWEAKVRSFQSSFWCTSWDSEMWWLNKGSFLGDYGQVWGNSCRQSWIQRGIRLRCIWTYLLSPPSCRWQIQRRGRQRESAGVCLLMGKPHSTSTGIIWLNSPTALCQKLDRCHLHVMSKEAPVGLGHQLADFSY